MKRALVVASAVLFLFAQAISAQAPPAAPKPGPEHKRIGYFLGTWSSEGDMKPSPFGPGGKFTTTDHNEWFPGGFFLVLHSDFKGSMGEGKSLAVMGYSSDEKAYTYYGIDSMGMADTSKGALAGDTWTFLSDSKVGGKPMKTRFTMKELSPTSYSFKLETSTGGGAWASIMEGKANKSK